MGGLSGQVISGIGALGIEMEGLLSAGETGSASPCPGRDVFLGVAA